jgi:hypothetical protein
MNGWGLIPGMDNGNLILHNQIPEWFWGPEFHLTDTTDISWITEPHEHGQ